MSTGDGRNILREFFRQNRWANLQLIEHCAELPDEVLDRDMVGAYGSPRKTLLHLVTSESDYAHMLDDGFQPAFQEEDGFPGFDVLGEEAERSGEALEEIAAVLQPDDTWTDVSEGKRWEAASLVILIQAFNHATEHREQVKAALSQAGSPVPRLDGWHYGFEHGLAHGTDLATE